MAQSRNSSGKGDETSDMMDVKALAARTRAQTGSHPILPKNPAEISGVRPRRDSVIGARLTPPPRVANAALPNWFWGVLGCLSVLLVGFGALFVLGQSGKLAPYLENAATAPPAASVAENAPAPAENAAAPAPEPEAKVAAHEAAPKAAEPAPTEKAPEPVATPPRAKAPEPEPEPVAAAPAEKPAAAPAEKPAAQAHVAAKAHASRPSGAAPGTEPESAADDNADDAPEAKATAPAKPARPKAAPAAAGADDGEDDQSAPGQDAVEAALDGLTSKVRGCFVKYQIKGIARVRLVATPGGTAESVSVTGDFEDTPTGLCVEAVLSGAKLPSFKGPPLKLSQSYQLR